MTHSKKTMIDLPIEKINARVRVNYKRRIRLLCKDIGIDSFSNRDMWRLLNRLMLIAGAGIVERDLTIVIRLYARELIGRNELTYEQQQELST